MTSEDQLLQNAIEAIRNGEKKRARDLLTRLINANRDNSEYWLWMSAVVETRKERSFCLKEALRLDPTNPAARRGLALMGEVPPDPQLAIPLEKQVRKRHKETYKPPSTLERFTMQPVWLQGSIAAGILILLIVLIVVIPAGIRTVDRTFFHPPTPITLDLSLLYTPPPTPDLHLPTPTFQGPTPLWMVMESTYTPTPQYVSTPHPRTEDYRAGMQAYSRRDFETAIGFFQQALKMETQSPDLYYHIGEAYRQLGKLGKANDAFIQALALNPNFAPAYVGRALTLITRNPDQVRDARDDIATAISLDPNFVDAYLAMAQIDLQQKDANDALSQVTIALDLSPSSALGYLYQAQALLLLGKPQEALESAQKAHELDFTLLPAYRVLGQAYTSLDMSREAVDVLNMYTLYYPEDYVALSWLGKEYIALGETDLALQALNHALFTYPEYFDALFIRGKMYLDQHQTDNALADLWQAARQNPHSFEASLELSKVYLEKKFYRLAFVRLSHTLGMAETPVEKAAVYLYLAQVYTAQRDIAEAIDAWNSLLALQEEDIPEEWRQTAEESLQALPTLTPTPRPTWTPYLTITPQATITPMLSLTPQVTATPTLSPTP
jgi:tetratricopeptide (TPR) repeat protein